MPRGRAWLVLAGNGTVRRSRSGWLTESSCLAMALDPRTGLTRGPSPRLARCEFVCPRPPQPGSGTLRVGRRRATFEVGTQAGKSPRQMCVFHAGREHDRCGGIVSDDPRRAAVDTASTRSGCIVAREGPILSREIVRPGLSGAGWVAPPSRVCQHAVSLHKQCPRRGSEATGSRRMGRVSRLFMTGVVLAVAMLIAAFTANAQTRGAAAPAAKTMKNPVASTPASITAGAAAYKKYCAFCHGVTGKGDGPLAPKDSNPADLTDAKWDTADEAISSTSSRMARGRIQDGRVKGKSRTRTVEHRELVTSLGQKDAKRITERLRCACPDISRHYGCVRRGVAVSAACRLPRA